VTARDEQFIQRMRTALEAVKAPPYTVSEILVCGCEPEVEHCDHCDGLRQANARREEAAALLGDPGNEKRLLGLIDRLAAEREAG
jgi:hypothetical protein